MVTMDESETTRHTCLKLEIAGVDPIFVKGTWYRSRFDLSITDGAQAWVCDASKEEVAERAAQWDQPATAYVELAERYLGFQQAGSVYGFSDALDGSKRLSWTFEKEGTKLEWRWKCKPSPDCKKTTSGILDFLMEANIRLSEEVVSKTRSFEKMKAEADKCLAQGETLCNEKREFETATYAKFLSVLNAKKAKLRELRDKLSEQENSGKRLQEEETSDKTESFDGESDDAQSEEDTSMKVTLHSTSRGRGRKTAARG
ncbi:PREDICTED: DNA repair protein XRCC4 [Tarenaya hassleriana]|uniref:DNA repair protein XRCC4 n=1 Tax=Tarenaya hassleriana TaxID=28532 RepID=UPI00053C1C6E|nr:PREDICTED: DNA repair protein XRCC4 [Tarenaya hassleriana]